MVLSYKTLCLILNIISIVHLTITVIILFAFADVLSFTRAMHVVVLALVAATITLTITLQMRSSHEIPMMEKLYGYTVSYQKMAMTVSLVTHVLVALLAIGGVMKGRNYSTDFLKLMRSYSDKQSSRSLVDEVQLMFQCCGSAGFNDWFRLHWSNITHKDTKRKKEIAYILFGKTISSVRPAVPYSCCSKIVRDECMHDELELFGTKTINTRGCGRRLKKHIRKQLWFQFSTSAVCITIEVMVLTNLFKRIEESPEIERKRSRSLTTGDTVDEVTSLTEMTPTRNETHD